MICEYKSLDVCSGILTQIQFIIMESKIYKSMLKVLNYELRFISVLWWCLKEKRYGIHVTNYVNVVFVCVHIILKIIIL